MVGFADFDLKIFNISVWENTRLAIVGKLVLVVGKFII